MNKKYLFILFSFIMVSPSLMHGEDQSASNQLIPPPVSVINWHKGVTSMNIRGIYMSMEPKNNAVGAMKITGGGLLADYNKAASDKFGFNVNLSLLGMDGKSEDTYSRNNMNTFMMNVNPNLVVELIGGEKKDIAGEIIKNGFSWAVFGGVGMTAMSFSSSQDIISTRTTKDSDPMSMQLVSMDYGTVFEIPLSWWISLAPSYTITKYMSGSITVGDKSYTIDSANMPSQSIFGADIFLRPLKLNPNLKVSLAMLAGMVQSNSDNSNYKSTMIMLGIQYEWGKHYQSTFFSPGITR